MAFILTTFYRLYLHWCILNAYSFYFVLILHTRDSVWTVTAETQTNRQEIFLFTFSYLSVVFYTTITKTVNLINIPINVTENTVDWNSYRGKTSKILTFSIWRLVERNGVLDETRTAERWIENSRAHARLSESTSGSRPSSFRPGILRCLVPQTMTECTGLLL